MQNLTIEKSSNFENVVPFHFSPSAPENDASAEKGIFRTIFEEAPHAMLLANEGGQIIDANPAANKMFTIRSLIGSSLSSIFAEGESLCRAFSSISDEQLTSRISIPTSKGTVTGEVHVSKLENFGWGTPQNGIYHLLFDPKPLPRKQEPEKQPDTQVHMRDALYGEAAPASAAIDVAVEPHDIAHDKPRTQPKKPASAIHASKPSEYRPGMADPLFQVLTPREIEVCRLVRDGSSTKEIASNLHLTFETVQTHRKNIRRKLGLNGSKASLQMFIRTRGRLAPAQWA